MIALLFIFIFLEILFRIIFGPGRIQDTRGNTPYIEDEELGYKLKPHYKGSFKEIDFDTEFNTNAQGFRGPDLSLFDENVIFMIGDSFIAGSGVEENETSTYYLQQRVGEKYKVYNLGVPGYSQKQNAVQLKKIIPLYDSELIIAHLYVGNDISDNCDTLPVIGEEKTTRGKIKALVKRSQFITIAYKKMIVPFKYPKNLDFYISDPRVEECYEKTEEYVEEMQTTAKKYNVPMILVIIPREPQTVSEREEALIDWYNNFEKFDVEKFDLDIVNKRVLEMCEEFRMDCLDVTSAFKKKDKREQLYLNDGHWNKNGHRLASEIVYGYLQENEYLK